MTEKELFRKNHQRLQLKKAEVFAAVLAPLIRIDYLQRAQGVKTDKWYWADEMGVKWGFCVNNYGYVRPILP